MGVKFLTEGFREMGEEIKKKRIYSVNPLS
jgi:hypothetical protein